MNIFKFRRKTFESDIEIKINFFGIGIFKIKTFNFFFDHIISQFINYSLFDFYLRCYSDLKNDSHHLIEDVSICLGKIFKYNNFNRYSSYFICMDDTFIIMSIDYCKRIFYYDNILKINYDIQLIREFFINFVKNFYCCLYIYILNFINFHHLIECIFKLFGILFFFLKKKNFFISTKGYL